MMIGEYAKTGDINILLKAKNDLESERDDGVCVFGYESLILNHMGVLMGIEECEYAEAQAYTSSSLLVSDLGKRKKKLYALAEKGYKKASEAIAMDEADGNPTLALKYFFECVGDPSVDQGWLYENIGFLYFNSDMLDVKEGVSYIKKAADQYNRPFAQFILASMLFNGEGVDKDIENSYRYCKQAAMKGDIYALHWIGKDLLYAFEYPLEKNAELGISYITRAAEGGNEKSQYLLGIEYYEGNNVLRDLEKAKYWFDRSTWFGKEMDDVYAYLGAVYYALGNYQEARKALEKSWREKNIFDNCEMLVDIYKRGLGGDPDPVSAIHLIERMILNGIGNKADCEYVADCYYEGIVVPKNDEKAANYYVLIEDESAKIKYRLGCIALNGTSTLLTKNNCIRYFENAGNSGIPDAYSKLAYYFLSLDNRDRALDYFKKSFNAGNTDDGVMVGKIYEAGTATISKNLSEAVRWYKTAAEKGNDKAKEELSHIKSTFRGYKRV